MRNFILLTAAGFLVSSTSFGQKGTSEQDLSKTMEVQVGGTFGKTKIFPKLDKLALAQVTVNFKQISSKSVTKIEKKANLISNRTIAKATATVSAYLNITDEDLTDTDYQEITDHFYNYFQKTLAQNNIDTVAWSTIAATDFFKNGKDDNKGKKSDEDKSQASVGYNAHTGATLYNGKNIFAFGKIKKAANFCDEIGAPAAFINTTVDFADILAEIDLKTSGGGNVWTPSYNSSRAVTKMKSKTTVRAIMKIPENSGISLFYDNKSHAENLVTVGDIPAEMDYAEELTEDPSLLKKKSKLFSVSFSNKLESTPVIISTTKDAYKKAAKKALERYADAFVAKANAMKK